MRKPIIAGNWKMNNNIKDTQELLKGIKKAALDESVEVVVCPPYISLYEASKILDSTKIGIGAQNMHWEDKGAYTGEISPFMLKEIGCKYIIIGHSERRQYFGETDEMVNLKVKSALDNQMVPIICVGEDMEQREKGQTVVVVSEQVKKGISGLTPKQALSIVIAYEPIWAIGTGMSSKGEDANKVAQFIRDIIKDLFGERISEKVRILYGGSVNPNNIKEYMSQSDIDGALVGGASLKADDFIELVNYKK
ncbi:MAG: triose-phosphate isomerase [Clostridium sp.]|nr:triose-phosphate isomerase [Clostridium sp.]HHY13862.1 triose-phosphate isomerase [Thermoanaerobacterales bacterium]